MAERYSDTDDAPEPTAEEWAYRPLSETFDPNCPRCDTDNHRCPGCGTSTDHARHVCAECNAANPSCRT